MKMSNKGKDIDMKNRTYYFIDDIINIENLNSNNVKQMKIHTKVFLFTIFDM